MQSQVRNISEKGTDYLAIPTAVTNVKVLFHSNGDFLSESGFIVKDGQIREWRFQGYKQIDEIVYIYGPSAEGFLFYELKNMQYKAAIPHIIDLIDAVIRLRNEGISVKTFTVESVFFLNDGGILFLPDTVMKRFGLRIESENEISLFNMKVRMLADFEKSVVLISAIFLYFLLTGRFPYSSEIREEDFQKLHKVKILKPKLVVPEIKTDVSDYLYKILYLSGDNVPGIADFQKRIAGWQGEELFEPVDDEEKRELLSRARELENTNTKQFARRLFIRKNSLKICIIAVVILAAGGVAGFFLSNYLKPLQTKDFTRREVVEAFYESMNTLDSDLMGDCVMRGAAKADINTVTTLYVVSRVRAAYERESFENSSVFGVSDLVISLAEDGPEPVYDVRYMKFEPAEMPDDEDNFAEQEVREQVNYAVYDRVTLVFHRGYWKIKKIDRVSKNIERESK